MSQWLQSAESVNSNFFTFKWKFLYMTVVANKDHFLLEVLGWCRTKRDLHKNHTNNVVNILFANWMKKDSFKGVWAIFVCPRKCFLDLFHLEKSKQVLRTFLTKIVVEKALFDWRSKCWRIATCHLYASFRVFTKTNQNSSGICAVH